MGGGATYNYQRCTKLQVMELQLRQVKIENVFAVERKALWDIITQQTKIMASMHRKSKHVYNPKFLITK